jgi:segregation and condensation protein B
MLSDGSAAGYIREFYKTKAKEKLSRPSLESLAIIAYKQPVSRADLEMIRGVNCDGTVAHLLNKGLIEIVGRKEVPGRPFIYGTTKAFLEYFGLKSLEDLPKLDQLPQLEQIATTISADMTPMQDGYEQVSVESSGQEPSGQSRLEPQTVEQNTQSE